MPPSFFCPASGDPYGSRNGVRTDLGHTPSSLDRAIAENRLQPRLFVDLSPSAFWHRPCNYPKQSLTMRNEKQNPGGRQ